MNEHVIPQEILAYDTPEKRVAYVQALDAFFLGDDYKFWRHSLIGELLPNGDGEIQKGYYRCKRRGRPVDSCIAIWIDKAGNWRVTMDGEDVDPESIKPWWNHFKEHPITHFEYGERLRTGIWSNTSEVLLGHNSAPADDSPEAIKDRLDDLVREAKRMIEAGGATDKNTADQASDVANALGELETKSDKLRVAEKEPHLEAGRAVDRKWMPLRDLAAEFKTRLKAVVVTPFLKAQAAEVEERRRKAEAAAKEAAQKIAEETGVDPASVQVHVPDIRNTAGSSKRSTGLRTVKIAKVTDWVALLTHLKDVEAIQAAAQKIANASAKTGIALPGTEIIEDQRAA